jgi:tetratricopeptide (TPR) repeat protein
LAALLSWPAVSQMQMGGHVMELQDETPPDKLPVPHLITGAGNSHMDITAQPEAQVWFNQGLNLLHDFWDYESARAFEQSIRVDPQCAMCYWGLYKAESFYHSIGKGYARQALDQAIALKNRAGERERLYIDATAAQVEAVGNARPDFSKGVQLWRQLVDDYPDDAQARIFLAQVVDHKESVALLQSILKKRPDDSAANHYYIHAVEGSEHPEEALHSADILASLAPASGHMVHMPGHIFFRLGDYARAEQAFAASMRVDEQYMKEQHVEPDNDWNYVHNLMYAIANLMEEGKFRDATALSGKLTGARGELESTLYVHSARDSISRLDPRLPVALRTADWPRVIQLLRAASLPKSRPNLEFLARQLAEFAAGMQAIDNRDISKAEDNSNRFDAELWRMSHESSDSHRNHMAATSSAPLEPRKLQVQPDALLEPLLSTLSIMSLELRASVLALRGDTSEAKRLFARAAQEEKDLGYHEPPLYIRPVGEAEGAAMMSFGAWKEAKAAYERALLERPRSGLALYGIAVSTEKAGDAEAAVKAYRDFMAAWKNADAVLPQLTNARAYVSQHSSGSAEGR